MTHRFSFLSVKTGPSRASLGFCRNDIQFNSLHSMNVMADETIFFQFASQGSRMKEIHFKYNSIFLNVRIKNYFSVCKNR